MEEIMHKKTLIGITIFGIISLSLFFILWNIPMVKAQNTQTLEGVWACVSAPPGSDAMGLRNQTVTILPKEGGYKANWSARPPSTWTYIGNDTRIEHTDMLPLSSTDLLSQMPDNVRQRVGDAQFRHTFSFTLVGDGNSAEFAEEGVSVSWDASGNYNTVPTKDVWTLNRVSGPTKVESQGEHAYAADCGPTVPNRTAPITTDLCPGNLVALSYFCGGDTGCPYVCCPKGLPYLNHCDCKCYAAETDFECGSHSVCQVQQRQ